MITLFAQAAVGMFDYMTDLCGVEETDTETVCVEGKRYTMSGGLVNSDPTRLSKGSKFTRLQCGWCRVVVCDSKGV